LHIYFII